MWLMESFWMHQSSIYKRYISYQSDQFVIGLSFHVINTLKTLKKDTVQNDPCNQNITNY